MLMYKRQQKKKKKERVSVICVLQQYVLKAYKIMTDNYLEYAVNRDKERHIYVAEEERHLLCLLANS